MRLTLIKIYRMIEKKEAKIQKYVDELRATIIPASPYFIIIKRICAPSRTCSSLVKQPNYTLNIMLVWPYQWGWVY